MAAICASVPVFWPILSHQWGRIFVTQEVVITTERRRRSDEDEFELTHSRQGSDCISQLELNLGQERPARKTPSQTELHYRDDYIMGQVDPLNTNRPVQAEVRSNSTRRKGKWFRV